MNGIFFQESPRMNKQLWEDLRFALRTGQAPSVRAAMGFIFRWLEIQKLGLRRRVPLLNAQIAGIAASSMY